MIGTYYDWHLGHIAVNVGGGGEKDERMTWCKTWSHHIPPTPIINACWQTIYKHSNAGRNREREIPQQLKLKWGGDSLSYLLRVGGGIRRPHYWRGGILGRRGNGPSRSYWRHIRGNKHGVVPAAPDVLATFSYNQTNQQQS